MELKVDLKGGDFEYPHKDHFIIIGGNSNNPNWGEYINNKKQEQKKYYELIKKYIEENNLIGKTGQWCNDKYFEFSDGKIFGFTWRAWGDLMQAIVNKREGYMTYYM